MQLTKQNKNKNELAQMSSTLEYNKCIYTETLVYTKNSMILFL